MPPSQKFHDPAATAALFKTFERSFLRSVTHKLIRVFYHANDAAFVETVAGHVRELVRAERQQQVGVIELS